MRCAPLVLVLTGCTTLGPVPSMTMVTPAPAGRPGVELGLAIAPGYFLSSGVTREPEGTVLKQLSLLFEPDRLIGAPGLFAGARLVGNDDSGTHAEPLLGYRRELGSRLAFGVVGYGTHARGEYRDARYSATRLGLEAAGDVRVTPSSHWLELHLIAGAALTGLWADGSYCVDSEGYGIDCPEPGGVATHVMVSASGVYPTAHAGAALALGKGLRGIFHGARLTFHAAAGTMPTAVAGVQTDAQSYGSLGLSFSLGLGAVKD